MDELTEFLVDRIRSDVSGSDLSGGKRIHACALVLDGGISSVDVLLLIDGEVEVPDELLFMPVDWSEAERGGWDGAGGALLEYLRKRHSDDRRRVAMKCMVSALEQAREHCAELRTATLLVSVADGDSLWEHLEEQAISRLNGSSAGARWRSALGLSEEG